MHQKPKSPPPRNNNKHNSKPNSATDLPRSTPQTPVAVPNITRSLPVTTIGCVTRREKRERERERALLNSCRSPPACQTRPAPPIEHPQHKEGSASSSKQCAPPVETTTAHNSETPIVASALRLSGKFQVSRWSLPWVAACSHTRRRTLYPVSRISVDVTTGDHGKSVVYPR
jgi:hypothetical protein